VSAGASSISVLTDDDLSDDAIYYHGKGLQALELELDQVYIISRLVVWHDYADGRIYNSVVFQCSPTKGMWLNLFNNDVDNLAGQGRGSDKSYVETDKGKVVQVPGIQCRYFRFWSYGSNKDSGNRYIELKVFASQFEKEVNVAVSTGNDANKNLVVDGDYGTRIYLGKGLTLLNMDLGAEYVVHRINIRRLPTVTYEAVVFQVSRDATAWETVFNSDLTDRIGRGVGDKKSYIETTGGKDVTFDERHTRYLRFFTYTNRNAEFAEVEVFANPSEWVLIMRIGEQSDVFGYDSPHWTDVSSTFNDGKNIKYNTFNNEPFKTIIVCVGHPLKNCVGHSFVEPWVSAVQLF
jgi:hypothetical protein